MEAIKEQILNKFKENYEYHINSRYAYYDNPYAWLCDEVLDLTTYDTDISLQIGHKLFNICKAILNGTTFEYIKDEKQYLDFIIYCNFLDAKGWITWGTSIRGCWFQDMEYSEDIIEGVQFSKENMAILCEFIEEYKNDSN